ncbi:MAG: ATP-binding cassette domain-containing protein, partial [Nanoarchaeota archaeon]
MHNEDSIISVQNLIKKFGKINAVNNISFSVSRGKITGLLGPNGAGKTTTIHMLLDLITPNSGLIKIFGKSLISSSEEILSRVNFSSLYVARVKERGLLM